MKRIITLVFGITFFFNLSFSQGRIDYDDSRWFWGLNYGSTWQTTDIKNVYDNGWGLTIGKSFNQNYGKLVSFDLRARYLYGKWYGRDKDVTDSVNLPQVLTFGETDYASGLGYAKLNFQTTVHRLALELVIHANGLRERTNWDLYAFGGVGFSLYRTKGNYLDAKNEMYDFSSNNLILDDTYETTLEGSAVGSYSVAMMPSLGVGIGYQLFKRFSLGVEHKTTFTRLDNFDGFISNKREKPDLYHYSSVYVRFQLKGGNNARPSRYNNNNSLNNVNNYTQNTQAPIVNFTQPSVSGTTVKQPNYVIRATVNHVNNRSNIDFRQNGNYMSNFSFNSSTGRFESSVVLNPGQNVFELAGTNGYGTDSKTTIVVYYQEVQAPPFVSILNPASSPYVTENSSFNFIASVLNVQQSNQVTMTVNGQPFSGFNFNSSNGNLNATLNLNLGTNIVTVTGTNQSGSDSKSTTIIFQQMQQELPPVVYFNDPHVSPYTSLTSSFLIKASVLNVPSWQNITFKQNGSVNQNFTYNASTDDFQSSVALSPGQNVFEIIASNGAGVAQATTIIIHQVQAPRPPIVTITNPTANPQTTENSSYVLGATVLNVTSASQIQVSLNGQNVSNFNYVNASNTVIANLSLNPGSNVVTVTGTNNDGTDNKSTTIIYRQVQKALPPFVTFISPSVDPFTTETNSYNVSANVLNVANSSGINVSVNGANFLGFNFNTTNQTVSFPVNLIEGANVIIITGTNTAGSDTKSHTIIYKKPTTKIPPVVTYVDPNINPTVVYSQNYEVTALVQHVQGAQNIQLKINGLPSTNFNYSPSSELMTFSTGLTPGSNLVEITATNSAGQDVETTTIIYRAPDPVLPPVVKILTPVPNPHEVGVSSTPISASILNVDNVQNILVKVNGSSYLGFNFNNSTKQLNFTMNLNLGENTVEISASNNAGQSSDSRKIIYKKEIKVQAPYVTFINPASQGVVVGNPTFPMRARVTNVDFINQIMVQQDGQTVNPSMYTFNSVSKEVVFNTSLNVGNNTFTVRGTNNAGTHSASSSVIYSRIEEACDKPIASFINPDKSGNEVSKPNVDLEATIQNISSVREIEVYFNGSLMPAGNFNVKTNRFKIPLVLNTGQNTIEIHASNKCGKTVITTTINFKPDTRPCVPPTISRILPNADKITVQENTIDINASFLNIRSQTEVKLLVNGTEQRFNFDLASFSLRAKVNLTDGSNVIVAQVNNSCGNASLTWTVTKVACNNPSIIVKSTSDQSGKMTTAEFFSLEASLSGINSREQIMVLQNGRETNFIFNSIQSTLSFNRPLIMGENKFFIRLKNECGEIDREFIIVRQKDPNTNPPKITITNPDRTPFTSEVGAMNISAKTEFVTAANQISVTVNGSATNFNFDVNSGVLNFNRTLVEGNNVIIATAVTPYGMSTDSKTIVYRKPVTVSPPVIELTNPRSCPATLNVGTNTITGTVKNITDLHQVTINLNGRALGNFNPILSRGELQFSFPVSMNQVNNKITLVINARNDGGSASTTCLLQVDAGQSCMPEVSADFAANALSVVASSTKDLSNVVLKFHDNSTEKFDNLSGLSRTFSGSKGNSGKCIVGIWIKSGCNQSNDGPGYGVYVENRGYRNQCSATPSPTTPPNTPCGPRFNPGNADWQFCLVTPSGTFSRKDLQNMNFTYKGPASSVYFSPIAGGGDVTVAGKPFKVDNGRYYLFTGNLNVDVSSKHPGSMGQWQICLEADKNPVSGVGNNRPQSPCENTGGNENSSGCMPEIKNTYTQNSQSVTVTSDKDLVNVVLKFSDNTTQTFDRLTGKTRTLKGTGTSNGKCIVGAWVKSGCNESSDGPNYGAYFENPNPCTTQIQRPGGTPRPGTTTPGTTNPVTPTTPVTPANPGTRPGGSTNPIKPSGGGTIRP
jgi:large repetitive protein